MDDSSFFVLETLRYKDMGYKRKVTEEGWYVTTSLVDTTSVRPPTSSLSVTCLMSYLNMIFFFVNYVQAKCPTLSQSHVKAFQLPKRWFKGCVLDNRVPQDVRTWSLGLRPIKQAE